MLGRRWAHPEQFLPLLLRLLALGCGVVLICELAIYYMVLLRCGWPRLKAPAEPGQDRPSAPALRTLFLADTHLLGALRGHWLDKLRREWQMERAFQTALWLFEPDAVFVLGDLFDEGKWSSPKDFKEDVRRFRMMFRHSASTELFVVVGNHDIGFHDEMDWYKLQRFDDIFNFSSAKVVSRKGVNWIQIIPVGIVKIRTYSLNQLRFYSSIIPSIESVMPSARARTLLPLKRRSCCFGSGTTPCLLKLLTSCCGGFSPAWS